MPSNALILTVPQAFVSIQVRLFTAVKGPFAEGIAAQTDYDFEDATSKSARYTTSGSARYPTSA